MSERDLDPLGPDLESLLDAERERPAAAPRSRNRVLSRVHASLAIGALGGGFPGGGDPALGGGGAPGGGGVPQTIGGGAGAATGGALASLFGKPVVIGLTAFALGGAVGAASVYANLAPAAPPMVAVSGRLSAAASAAPFAPPGPADPAPLAQPSETPGASAVPSARAPAEDDTAGHDATLAAERALLEVARNAVARKDSGAAFEALSRHAREFPRGRLSEEREALWIQALIGTGHMDDARVRASRFKKSFPRSMLLPAFEKALGTIP